MSVFPRVQYFVSEKWLEGGGEGKKKTFSFSNLSMNLSMLALSWLNETQEGEKTTINSRSCAFPNVQCQCAEWRHPCCIVSLWGEGRTSFMSCVSVMQQRQNVSSTSVDLKCGVFLFLFFFCLFVFPSFLLWFCVIIKPLKHKLLCDWNGLSRWSNLLKRCRRAQMSLFCFHFPIRLFKL